MKFLLNCFIVAISLVGCKLVEQPKKNFAENILFEKINFKYRCLSIERFFSDTYLRYQKSGDYSLKIICSDSTTVDKIEIECDSLAVYVDTAILKGNSLINEINFHLIYLSANKSFQNTKYVVFKRGTANLQKQIQDY